MQVDLDSLLKNVLQACGSFTAPYPRALKDGIRLGAPMVFRCWKCADMADTNCAAQADSPMTKTTLPDIAA